MLAVWPVAYPGAPSYPGQLARVIDEAFPDDGSPVVLAGDLNAPIASTLAAHLRNVQRLDELGLHSGFLASRGLTAEEAHVGAVGASAPVATYYQHRRRNWRLQHRLRDRRPNPIKHMSLHESTMLALQSAARDSVRREWSPTVWLGVEQGPQAIS